MANGGGFVYRFSQFQLDADGTRLQRGADIVPLAPNPLKVLRMLAEHGGRVVSREALLEAVWGTDAIGENSLDRAISALRKAIDSCHDGPSWIESVKRKGFRLTAPVERVPIAEPAGALAMLLDHRRVQVESRDALDTWDLEAIARTPEQIEQALLDAPDEAALYVELAMAYALRYESTRDDAEPNNAARNKALTNAEEGVRRAPDSAEAWSTLGLAHGLLGHRKEAVMACTEAVAREPSNPRHAIRMAHAIWGQPRRDAAEQLIALAPLLAIARWLAATVDIARRALAQALEHLAIGCALQDAQPAEGGKFPTIGCHLLRGLILLETNRIDDALEAFWMELESRANQIYSRECFANTYYAIGAALYRLGRLEEAREAFEQALTFIEGHGRATAGLAVLAGEIEISAAWHAHDPVDAAIVRAIPLACGADLAEAGQRRARSANQREEAAAIVLAALELAPPGQSGWQLPVEPMLHTSAHLDLWSSALELVAMRAM